VPLPRVSRFPRTGGRVQRRPTSWGVGARGTLQVAADTINLFSSTVVALEDGLTIVRTRGELNLTLSAASVASDGWPQIAVGLCIVSENAAGVGVTAIPDPIADIGWDGWFWYWTGSLFQSDVQPDGSGSARIVVDSKAMRKFKGTDVVVGVLSALGELQTSVFQATLNTRTLVKIS